MNEIRNDKMPLTCFIHDAPQKSHGLQRYSSSAHRVFGEADEIENHVDPALDGVEPRLWDLPICTGWQPVRRTHSTYRMRRMRCRQHSSNIRSFEIPDFSEQYYGGTNAHTLSF